MSKTYLLVEIIAAIKESLVENVWRKLVFQVGLLEW